MTTADQAKVLTPQAFELIAGCFRTLGEPMRLKILCALQGGQEKSVGQLAAELGSSQANISKHLKSLVEIGLLVRRQQGTAVFYRVAKPEIFQICDIICKTLADRLTQQAEMLGLNVSPSR